MAIVAARRSGGAVAGTGQRARGGQPESLRQQQERQRLLALAVSARIVASEPTESAAVASDREVGWLVVMKCVITVLRAVGMACCLSSFAARGDRGRCNVGATANAYALKVRRLRRGCRPPKRLPVRACAEEMMQQQQLLRGVPCRITVDASCNIASLYTQKGRKGINQDAMIVCENFASRQDTAFCGVFDGHGPYGHLVSKRVRDILPLKLGMYIGSTESAGSSHSGNVTSSDNLSFNVHEETGSACRVAPNRMLPENFTALKESFLKAFNSMDKDLRYHKNIDCCFSGTTAVTIFKQGQDLVIGNLGDSRAVLATRDENNCIKAVQLTVDLKPSLPREAERICRSKGRIFALRKEPHVPRVWMPNTDVPGLAMSRSLGDFCLKDYGLISVPQVFHRRVTEEDQFMVLATDGIWDVLSNREVVEIVSRAPTRSSAARYLVESAMQAWKLRFSTSKVDDCTAVCLFLHNDLDSIVPDTTTSAATTQ